MATNESLAGLLHRHLVERESRGFGDTHNAMRRLQGEGLSFWTQWNVRAGKALKTRPALVRALVEAWETWLRREAEANLRLRDALKSARQDEAFTTDVERFEAAALALLAELEGAPRSARPGPARGPHPRPLPLSGGGGGGGEQRRRR